MPQTVIKNRQLRVGNKEIPFISGEFHYWRAHPENWKPILKQMKNMGLSIVSTYVPWHFHEYQKGKFDFSGRTHPARNLTEFLKLTQREKMWVVIRPGPYIYSEWQNLGIPDAYAKYHRLHPLFLKAASKYIAAVSKVIKPYLSTRARGNVVMLQADNEIDPMPDIYGKQLGLSKQSGLFQTYLEELYHKKIRALNLAWKTDYKTFKEAGAFIATMLNEQPRGLPLQGHHELRRHLDFFSFKHDYAKKYGAWVVKQYRGAGIDVPIYTNAYPFFYAHSWTDLQEISDAVGVDFYPSSEFNEDAFEQRKFIDKIRYLNTVSTFPFIAEFSSGVWHDHIYQTGPLGASHYRLLAFSALLGGIVGWNWYMLVNRDNWCLAPINEWARPQANLFGTFKDITTLFLKLKPASLSKIADVGVTFNPLQYAARTISHNSPVPVALSQADIDYHVIDIKTHEPHTKVLFYSGNQWMDADRQANLKKYVESGGTLVAFRDYPRKDFDFETHSALGFEEPAKTLFEFKKAFSIQLSPNRPKIKIISSVYVFDKVKGEKIETELGSYGRCTIGYIKRLGKGKIVHLGVAPAPEIMGEILATLGITNPSQVSVEQVQTALFKRQKSYYLVITNNGKEPQSVSVELPALKNLKLKARDLEGHKVRFISGTEPLLITKIPAKDGRLVELCR